MRLGYSCWGFLGPGVIDTPDGGRSHRRPLLDGLAARGHVVTLLQPNRDLHEVGLDLTNAYCWDGGLPDLDALMLEWRWPIPGRNTTACDAPGHTCDLHRQHQLLTAYTAKGVPTVIWDKDRRLPARDSLRRQPNVAVCEAALAPTPGAARLLFGVADGWLDSAEPADLAALPRPLPLVYIGNQYDRDDAFDRYFAPAAARWPHRIAGKWPRRDRWPGLTFTGRIGFDRVDALYRTALTTVLLLPERYAAAGQITQRLFEAVLAGCLPIAPPGITRSWQVVPAALHARDGDHVAQLVGDLTVLAGTAAHTALLADCLTGLDTFRLSRQLTTLDTVLEDLTHARPQHTPEPRP